MEACKAPRTTDQKLQTKIRLLIARLAQMTVLSPASRRKFQEETPWHPRMTMIPSEWSRTIGDVREEARKCFARGESVVIAPVLMKPSGDGYKLSVAFIHQDEVDDFWAENIGQMNPAVTIGELMEVLSPNKRWDFNDIDSGRDLNSLLDMA